MRPLAPSANAVAHMRRKPVTRDRVVAVDMVAVERAMDGLLMGAPLSVSVCGRCLRSAQREAVALACTSVPERAEQTGAAATVPLRARTPGGTIRYTRIGH